MEARNPRRRGYAMIVALLIITLLVAGGALMVQELMVRSKLLRAEANELHLQNVLDSAVSHMMAKYRYDLLFAGEDHLSIDGGVAKIRAEVAGTELRKLTIDAQYHGLRRQAVVALFVKSDQPIRLIDYQYTVGYPSFAAP